MKIEHVLWPLKISASLKGHLALRKLPMVGDSEGMENLLSRCLTVCGPERRRQALSFRHLEDALRCAVAGALLDSLASSLVGAYEECRLPSGQPALRTRSDLHVSISHSGDWVASALSRAPIGIDLEYEDPRSFTPGDGACREWTNIESYLKYQGWGLMRDPGPLRSRRGPDGGFVIEPIVSENLSAHASSGQDLPLDENHWLSVYGDYDPLHRQGDLRVCSVL